MAGQLCCVAALHEEKRVHLGIDREITLIETFGFRQNGTISMKWQSNPLKLGDVGFFLCTRRQWSALLSLDNHYGKFCQKSIHSSSSPFYMTEYFEWDPIVSVCELTMMNFANPRLMNYTVLTSDLYTLAAFNCLPCEYSSCQYTNYIILNYTLLNPDGDQLSTADHIYTVFYQISFFWWLFLVLTFIYFIIDNYFQDPFETPMDPSPSVTETAGLPLHVLLVLIALLKGGVAICQTIYWDSYKNTGVRGSRNELIEDLVFSFSECLLFGTLLLIGHGWCIVVRQMHPEELQTILSTVVAFLLSLIFFSLSGSTNSLTSLFVFYVFLLPNIFSSINQNLEWVHFHFLWMSGIENQIQPNERPQWRWMVEALRVKLAFYISFRHLVFGFLIIILGVNIIQLFIPWYMAWISTISHDILVFCFLWKVFYHLRPCLWKEGLFYDFMGLSDTENRNALEMLYRIYNQMESGEFVENQKRINALSPAIENSVIIQFPVSAADREAQSSLRNVVLLLKCSLPSNQKETIECIDAMVATQESSESEGSDSGSDGELVSLVRS